MIKLLSLKKSFLVFSFVLILIVSWAQPTVKIGEANRIKISTSFAGIDFLEEDESGLYGIQIPVTEVYGKNALGGVRRYSFVRYMPGTFNNPVVQEMKLDDDGAERKYEFNAIVGGQIYVFTSFKNRKLKKTFLFSQTYNKKTLQLNADMKKVMEIDYSDEGKYDDANFRMRQSKDKSKILIHFSLLNKGETVGYGFWVFDQKLNMLWQNENPATVDMNEDQVFQFRHFFIDNAGDVYLLGRMFDSGRELNKSERLKKKSFLSNKRFAQREPNYQFHVVAFRRKGNSVFYKIEGGDKFITDLQLSVNDKQEIILAGFYADAGKVNVIGTTFLKIAKDAKAVSEKYFYPFGVDFLVKGTTEKRANEIKNKLASGDRFDFYEYNFQDIEFMDNGTYTLVAEQTQTKEVTYNSGRMISVTYEYHDDDIYILNFSSKGQLNWKQKIDKDHHTSSTFRLFASFSMAAKGNNLYFVYNDMPPKKENSGSSIKKAKLVIATVNEKGDVSNTAFGTPAEAGFALHTMLSSRVKNDWYFYVLKTFNYKVLKVKL